MSIMQETIKNINRSKKLPLGKLPLGNILYLFLDKIAKSEWMPFIRESFEKSGKHISEAFASQVCDTVECIEERKGELIFVDPVYRLWFSQEY